MTQQNKKQNRFGTYTAKFVLCGIALASLMILRTAHAIEAGQIDDFENGSTDTSSAMVGKSNWMRSLSVTSMRTTTAG